MLQLKQLIQNFKMVYIVDENWGVVIHKKLKIAHKAMLAKVRRES